MTEWDIWLIWPESHPNVGGIIAGSYDDDQIEHVKESYPVIIDRDGFLVFGEFGIGRTDFVWVAKRKEVKT